MLHFQHWKVSTKHLCCSHVALQVNDDGVTDELSVFLTVFVNHGGFLGFRRRGFVHESCEGRKRLTLLRERRRKRKRLFFREK